MKRRVSKKLYLATLPIGGGAPIVVQSMNSVPARDVEANLRELERLHTAGCELSRIAVPDAAAAACLAEIIRYSPLPLVADIHFDYRLALLAIEAGAAGLRLNPGNIKNRSGLRQVAAKAKAAGVPIRVGVNAGSLDRGIIQEEGGVNAQALWRQAEEAIALLEAEDFTDICLSIKASDPRLFIEANLLAAEKITYPLHLGLTEAGPRASGTLRSAVALAPLLYAGIGDTIRISLTADPVEEVVAAYQILQALGLREYGATLISCPGCGRTAVDIRPLAAQVEAYLQNISAPLKVAVMGCAVNGPGEAREADFGIAGGKAEYLLFAKGKILRKVAEEDALSALVAEIEKYLHAER